MRLHQRIRREQARHTDDWLITYADTITLLLCLFVIILSVRTGAEGLARGAAGPVALAAAPDDIFAGNPPFHAMACNVDPAPGAIVEAPPAPIVETAFPPPRRTGTVADRPPVAMNAPEPTRQVSVAAGPAPTPATAEILLPAIMDRLKSQGTPVVEQRGDQVTTLQIGSTAFFSSGYATISGAGKAILADVAVTLKSAAFAGYHISIEGHTDDMPISTPQFQSNWELSTARAAAVVRFFLEQGIPARQLTAAGYADTFPVAPNRSADGTVIPENQARNRRVVIKLEKIEKPAINASR